MKLIGLSGPARSGKDTVGQMLIEEATRASSVRYCRTMAFADALKDVAQEFFQIRRREELEELKVSEENIPGWPFTMRHFLQHIGTEGFRDLDPDVWVKKLAQRLDGSEKHHPESLVVITDVRFPNEARWVVDQGGFMAMVSRPGVLPVRGHRSEQMAELEEYITNTIHNNAVHYWEDHLRGQVKEFLGEIYDD